MGDLTDEISQLLKAGIKVRFNGYDINSEWDMQGQLLTEDDCCMRDYIEDDEGRYVQVNFDILREF